MVAGSEGRVMSPATAEEGGYRFIGSAQNETASYKCQISRYLGKKFPIYLQLHPLSFLTECPSYNSVSEISRNTIFGEAEDTTYVPFSAFTL